MSASPPNGTWSTRSCLQLAPGTSTPLCESTGYWPTGEADPDATVLDRRDSGRVMLHQPVCLSGKIRPGQPEDGVNVVHDESEHRSVVVKRLESFQDCPLQPSNPSPGG
jgi:hypothetical protein